MTKEAETLEQLRLPESGVDYGMCSDADRNMIRAKNEMLDRCIETLRAAASAPTDCYQHNALYVYDATSQTFDPAVVPEAELIVAGEPVAWAYFYDGMAEGDDCPIVSRIKAKNPNMQKEPWTEVPLYAHPAPSGRDPTTIEACALASESAAECYPEEQGMMRANATGFGKKIAERIRALAAPAQS